MAADPARRRLVWLTGASSGIGRATALELARHGDRVAASARSADELAKLAGEAEGILPHPVDVTDEAAMAATAAAIEAAHGPIDVAILNAGTHRPVEPDDFRADAFRKLVDVNIMGVVHGIAAVLPAMRARRAGRIVVVASVAGYRGLPTAAAYGATKAALINLAEALKLDLDSYGVEVQLICPGFVETPLTDKNPFPMPFIIPAEEAARRIRAALAGTRFEVTFPRRFTWQVKALRLLPDALYFRLMHRLTGR